MLDKIRKHLVKWKNQMSYFRRSNVFTRSKMIFDRDTYVGCQLKKLFEKPDESIIVNLRRECD